MSDEDVSPNPSRMGKPWPRFAAIVGLAIVMTAGVTLMGRFNGSPTDIPTTVMVFVAALIMISAVVRVQLRHDDAADETRQRVREAEHDFEEALRAGRPHVPLRDADIGADPPAAVEPVRPSPASGLVGLALPELWTLTHSRLDHYHETALRQARRSFQNAQMAMVAGFALLVLFVAMALYASTTAGAVVAGGLGGTSAALGGYVSRTFVRSQETSASHLRAYFDQPLEFARFLAAERIVMASGLTQKQRAEALTALVSAMVSGPAAPAEPGQKSAPE
ncbi:TRADD-N-associated membrane domain-containing protein [Streptomyces sp. DSM 118148]|uniref:TRADD-N-associated membrane domain-containing protein n=1 Tax=Streptomyces sp. DSM 118148 TaxID=3448667 RepID=UPI0040403314